MNVKKRSHHSPAQITSSRVSGLSSQGRAEAERVQHQGLRTAAETSGTAPRQARSKPGTQRGKPRSGPAEATCLDKLKKLGPLTHSWLLKLLVLQSPYRTFCSHNFTNVLPELAFLMRPSESNRSKAQREEPFQ